MNELISVIVPVYNVADYLPGCVDSILCQTYADLEILLIDDGSTDGSGELCDWLAGKDARIRVIHQQNRGVSAARNEGLKACRGKKIGFVDADDLCDREMYAKLAACMEENDADVVMCGYIDYPYGSGIPVKKGIKPHKPCGFTEAVQAVLERNGYFTSIWNKLYRREAVEKDGEIIRMDPSLAIGEDEVWLFHVMRNCGRIAFLPEVLYEWSYREGSAIRNKGITEKQLSALRAQGKMLELLPDDEKIRTLARGKVYNDCYVLKVQAYCAGDREAYRLVAEKLRPLRKDWIRSKDHPLLRKIKVMIMDTGMKLRFPAGWIQAINGLQGR